MAGKNTMELVRSLLPEPIRESNTGLLAGYPAEVVVRFVPGGVEVAPYAATWKGPSELVPNPKDWRRVPPDREDLLAAIETARKQRRATFAKCRHCGTLKPPEWRNGDECHSCMEKRGVVF